MRISQMKPRNFLERIVSFFYIFFSFLIDGNQLRALRTASAVSTAMPASAFSTSSFADARDALAAANASRAAFASKSETRQASSARSWTDESALTVTVPLDTKYLEMAPSAPVTDTTPGARAAMVGT